MTELPPRLRGTLADPVILVERAAMRGRPHVQALDAYAARLRMRHGAVPDVDPADGGVHARLLLLLETPGPRAAPLRFVSRDNPTGTASNLRAFLTAAGLARHDIVIWNAVPHVIHAEGARNRTPSRAEVAAGLAELPAFLALLPDLRVVVLAGRVAGRARSCIAALRPGLTVLEMPHPSPILVCTDPAVPARIVDVLGQAALMLGAGCVGFGSSPSRRRQQAIAVRQPAT